MENKTPMQELIEYLENNSLIDKKYLISKCKKLLEKEKQMYSEEDMQEYAEYCTSHVLKSQVGHPYLSATKWLEQIKKK
jgi:hypothetical protein